MMISQRFRAARSNALCSVVSFLAGAGALPPASDVEKNNGSIRSKSSSSVMRCISTEPTMPRQPTKPVNLLPIAEPFQRKPYRTKRKAPERLARGRMLPEPDQPAVVLLALALDKALSVSPLWALAAAMPQGEQAGGRAPL